MREQKSKRITIIIVVLSVLVMVGAVYACSRKVSKYLNVEMQNTLRDVAEQNDIAVQKEIDVGFELLSSIAQEIEGDLDNVSDHIDTAQTFVQNYRFIRIGYIYPIGVAYTTDGYIQDMSYLDFFQEGMTGEATVTDALEVTPSGETKYVNRFGVPVVNHKTGENAGVLYGTYSTMSFEEILNTKSFDALGYSCIVKPDGTVIAHSKGSPIHEISDFFSLLDNGNGAGTDREQMEATMAAGVSGTGSFRLDAEQAFFYKPLETKYQSLDWYMITVVPEAVLTERVQPIMSNVETLVLIVMLITLSGIGIFLLSQRMRKQELLKLAYTDSLTGGDNYPCFQEKYKGMKNTHGYMVAMDLSEFKVINNTCGVERGDEALRKTWELIHMSVKDNELAARIYADRFIMFLTDDDREFVKKRLNQLREKIAGVSEILGIPRVIPVFGVYHVTEHGETETDYGNAVQAKRLVKGRRDCCYAFYDELDYAQVLEDRQIQDGFEKAITDKQFEVWYQPKYSAENSEIVGAEALVRWRKEDGSLLPPIKFIPIFERNGMIPRLDEYVFRMVCKQQKQWELEGKKIFPISVNISRVSLYYSNIVEKYKSIVEDNGVNPKDVQLEITESATIDNNEISHLIEQFHEAGFDMLLDDFGSGYSSLATLNIMHFDTMKLDKSLIDYIGDESGEKLLLHITKLAQSLGLSVTAEGVETESQLNFLRNLKCNDIQGYYFSKPLPLKEFEQLIYPEG